MGRSLATVRAWVRAGRLVGYREDPADPRSRLMLHPAELAAVAAELDPDGKHGAPVGSSSPPSSPPPSSPPTPRPAADEGAGVEVARLRAELDGARAILAEARRRGDDLALALTRRDDLGLRVELARLRAELVATWAVLEATRAHVATLEASAATVGDLVASARAEGRELARVAEEHARDLRADLDRMREERDAARAEAAALKSYAGLPWWRRMVTGPTAALEVDES